MSSSQHGVGLSSKRGLTKITVPWKRRFSKYVVFPERQLYFWFLSVRGGTPQGQGEAYFWRGCDAFGATLTDVWWKMHSYIYMWFSMELIKSQGVLPSKWIIGNRPKSCSSWVCFRRHQNGVHQTPLSVDPNEHKLLTWLQPWQNAAWCHCQK